MLSVAGLATRSNVSRSLSGLQPHQLLQLVSTTVMITLVIDEADHES